jgi:hypothetical protein
MIRLKLHLFRKTDHINLKLSNKYGFNKKDCGKERVKN